MIRPILLLVAGIVVLGIGIEQVVTFRRQAGPSRPPTLGVMSTTSTPILTATTIPTAVPNKAITIGVAGLSYVFRPASLTVHTGTSLVWVNRTAAPHTVTSLAGRVFNLTVNGWRRGRLVLHRPGTYRYFCSYHPYMLGVVTVIP